MFKKEELKLLWPFYLSRLFSPHITSAYAILYLLGIGLSFFQVSVLLAVNCIIHVLCDIPTGAIADIFGRKFSVITSLVFSGLLFMLVPLSDNFYYILILFIIWGVTQTLETGADQAWVVSYLKSNKREDLIEVFYSKMQSLSNIGVVFWPLVAAFIVSTVGIKHVWTFQGIFVLVSAILLMFAGEYFKREQVHIRDSVRKTIKHSKEAINYGVKHPIIFKMLIAMVFIGFVAAGGGIMWQPYMNDFGLPLEYFGFLLSLGGILAIFVPLLSAHLARNFSKKSRYLALLMFAQLIIFLAVLLINSVIGAAIIVTLLFLMMEFVMPVEGPFFQKFLPEKKRATLGSFKSTLSVFGAGLVMVLTGLSADLIGSRYTLAALGIFTIPPLLLYLKIGKRGH